ncbi:MAG: hypothetical protein JWM43_4144 [Acidobacteriaceae bacterium]|nr:hypothetical protein [Acidobacteriaceae bacterium]
MSLSRAAHRIALVAAALSVTLAAAPLLAATPAEQAVLAPIQAFFDGMAARDAAAIKAVSLPGGTLISFRDGKPTQSTLDAFAERIGKPAPTRIEERIHNPLVHIDNELAVVWAPFEFLIEGKVDHCGTDLFNLVRNDGKWVVASIAFNSRKDCAAK